MQIAMPHTAVLDVTNGVFLIPSLDICLQDVCSMYIKSTRGRHTRGAETATQVPAQGSHPCERPYWAPAQLTGSIEKLSPALLNFLRKTSHEKGTV